MSGYAKERASDRIATLTRQGLDLVTLWRESSEILRDAVPYYQAPCWYTLDPASLLVTSHFNEGMPELPQEWLAQEYYGDDVNNLADVARSTRGISTLHDATGGNPASSPRWHENMTMGGDQELIACLRTRSGEVWGAVGLYRESGQPLFGDEDQAFLRSIAPVLAAGARNSLLLGAATDPEGSDAPGLIVVTGNWEIESATPGVEHWLRDLPDGDWETGRLPSAVLAVAGQALRTATYPDAGEVAVSRVMSRSGRWVVLHGTSLVSSSSRRVAVIVEPAHPGRIAPLLMSAYGLTEREQEITRLVLQGNSTTDIAEQLVVSTHTVQQHLKSVFDKTGVRSRRDLVGKIFFAHYEPRVRDNERRAIDGQPLRGGPSEA
ncbi:regulatory LuxR family protein [Kribbella steppae]|uniref:Regulatory LuxR family protein n=1 Tax=Kribbella steppae TaxID=2512223 RepID=A0A4R2HG68_9ACTN|nr:helix-turn-helix transcriptional regulator [Kribbella steppae]TCO28184.1 regulatory LuxR family protein [Kribbella steppae]